MQRLEKIMNFAVSSVAGRHELDHTWDMGEKLDSSTARQLYEQYSLNLVHKIRCNIKVGPLSSQFQVKSLVCSLTPDRSLILPSHA